VSLAIFSVNLSFGVFFKPLLKEFSKSRVDTSAIFSIQTLTLYLSAAAVGGIADRWGTRRLTSSGTVLYAVGLLATTGVSAIWEMYVTYGVVTGCGIGVIYVIFYTTVSRWFERRRGVATGIATAGAGIGVFVLPAAAYVLFQTYT